MKTNKYLFLALFLAFTGVGMNAQEKNKSKKEAAGEVKEGDRNVMLNAANNTGPRDVNIGLPASTGGTTVLENGIPTVFFYWPELPPRAWRNDASIAKRKMLDLGQTAVRVGEVGVSLSTFNNLGTDKFQGKGSLNSNHFGLMRGDINLSGPINQKGLKFSVGAYGSFDPGTFKPKGITRYYNDKAQLYKAALTQEYKGENIKGSITAFYKYANIDNINNKYSPFRFDRNGKVSELDNFRLGRDSYIEQSGVLTLKDAYTGQAVKRDPVKDYGTASHTLDIIGKNTLSNGLNIDYILRYRYAKTGMYTAVMTGVENVANLSGKLNYVDDGSAYAGENVQSVMNLASRRTPMNTLMGTVEVGRKSGNHKWSVGIDQWYFETHNFLTESSQYYQEVAPNPRKLKLITNTNPNGDMRLNANYEYYDGSENKTALFFLDKWDVSNVVTLDFGARLQYFNLRGNYIKSGDRKDQNGNIRLIGDAPKSDIKHDWLTKAVMVNAVIKLTDKFGLLGEAVYNEDGAHLNKYSSGKDPQLEISKVPEAAIGVFYNHKFVSLVSKATYINRNNYRTTVNFSNPNNSSDVERAMTQYDVQTLGWTTDILFTPAKSFNLHFLLTLQQPKYKNFNGDLKFSDGTVSSYDFGDKTVTGVPKVLIEIDPSYTWKDLRVWASARYFSKQYFNKPNTLYFDGRWETFAGVNYKISKNFDVSATFVNLLNQRGVSGSIPDADLIVTDADVKSKEGTVMSGTYIRPFTAEFGVKYKF